MISNSLKVKPIVFVGKYQNVVEQLLSEHTKLLEPKVIWLEYRAIPVLHIMKTLRDHPHLSDQFYFLEISTLEALEQLLKSNVLFTIEQHGFSTIIINIPRYCPFPKDFHIRFHELMRSVNIILIMDKLVLPRTSINLVHES
ncbi:MAG: hypothetical protein ACW991_02670 [Candidatus Hodarchaeales archaeon]